MSKVIVTISDEDGDVLDQFTAEPVQSNGLTVNEVAHAVRDLIEHHYEVGDRA